MKTLFKFMSHLTFIFIITCFFSACSDQVTDDSSMFLSYSYNIAYPEGGVVELLNGNVTLNFPYGAVNKSVEITADICDNKNGCNNYLLQTIKIEPFMKFEKPVTIYFKYDGGLENYDIPPESCSLIICFWETEASFLSGDTQQCINCCVDTVRCAVKFCTEQTGVFAIGFNNNGIFN